MARRESKNHLDSLTIRHFRSDDLDQLLALNLYGLAAAGIAADDDYYAAEDFLDLEGTYVEAVGGAMLVGEVDRKIVAMGGIRRVDSATCELLRMRVHPAYQGRGYGQAILEALEREAQRLGYGRIELITGENQHPPVDIYSRHGYQVTSQEMLISIPSVHMCKDLEEWLNLGHFRDPTK